MDSARKEFLEIVRNIRSHLEYQKALGVREVEIPAINPLNIGPSRSAPRETSVPFPPVSPPTSQKVNAESAPPAGLESVREELGACRRCRLAEARKNIVFGEGNPRAALVFVGEGPGAREDEEGRPFVGEAGQLLTDIIVKGMHLRRQDVYICNVVKCRTPDNGRPGADELETCLPFLLQQIRAIRPRVIVTLGNTSAHALLKTGEGISKLRGTWHEFEGIPVMPTYHPSYLLRSPSAKKEVWIDIKMVMKKLKMPVPAKEQGR